MSNVIQIGLGVMALWGVENGPSPFSLLWPVAYYTTACTTVQAVISRKQWIICKTNFQIFNVSTLCKKALT